MWAVWSSSSAGPAAVLCADLASHAALASFSRPRSALVSVSGMSAGSGDREGVIRCGNTKDGQGGQEVHAA